MKEKLSIGSDPEFFLRDSSGSLITAIGLLGGTKKRPRGTPNGSVQEDGVAAEFNSLPSSTLKDFIKNHNLVMDDMRDILEPQGVQIDLNMASAFFDEDLLKSEQALTSGCDPDYNAWDLSNIENPIVDLYNTNLRATGGHLHIEFVGCKDVDSRINFTRVLDYQIGVPSIILDRDKSRRTLYGKAGAHRPKFKSKHGFDGIEYRVLSNFWLRNNDYMKYIYERVEHCNLHWESLIDEANYLGEEIRYIINKGDSQDAIAFCDYHKVATYV